MIADSTTCLICSSKMSYYFSKNFEESHLGNVDYWRCESCGFVSSKTHFDMTDAEWQDLNDTWHAQSHSNSSNPYNRNQRYFNQALMLSLMKSHDLISDGGWLDWGAGVGAVSGLLEKYFGGELLTYDKYLKCPTNPLDEDELKSRSFDLVTSMAVFEHVRSRSTLDEIESYVNETGCLGTHTLVPDEVPADPDWMYLLPVHCAFHTNKSMQLLMDSWGYTSSVYNEHSKLWVWFKKPSAEMEAKVNELNESMGWEYLHFKKGFMDYWK